jgi:tRNA pseudouridine13 synthase
LSNPAGLALPEWRRAYGPPVCSGLLRQRPEDFQVREILPLEFSGDGEHDWLWIRKTSVNTAWLARQLARFAGVQSADVGFSGQKDRHAVTEQWFSVRRARGEQHDWADLDLPGVIVSRVVRHSRKLRRGTHRANAFQLTLREVSGDPAAALQRIAGCGVPNYFGEQRFGREGSNLALAESLFAGKRLKREPRSMALSAARSFIFNEVLDARIADGSWSRLLAGDIACLDGSNSHFAVPKPDDELLARCEALDLHPSGPMWGRQGNARERSHVEQEVLQRHAGLCAGLERHVDAARRSLRVRPAELQWQHTGSELTLSFSLPSGCFATAVLREIIDYEDCSLRSSPPQ